MENRSQFTFYESFYNALRRIKKKADRADAYDAICAYALFGIEPDMDALPDAAAIAFELVKPNLDSSRRKASNGKKGGQSKQTPSKDSESEGEANGDDTASKPQANAKQNQANGKQTASKKENKKKKEKEVENECYNPLTPLQAEKFSPTLLAAVNDWLCYKHERKEEYTPKGLEAMTSEIRNKASQHGDTAVIACIHHCMAQNWKGIIWDKLPQPSPVQPQKGRQSWAELAQQLESEGR